MTKITKGNLTGDTCYYCGPMDDVKVPDRGAGWRKDITPFFHSLGVGVLDPCDKPSSYVTEDDGFAEQVNNTLIRASKCQFDIVANNLYDEVHELMKPVVGFDLDCVDKSSFIVMYVNTDFHMCGSYAEQHTAILQRKPVLVMCEQGKHNIPKWLYGILKHREFFSTWNELRSYVSGIHNGSISPHKHWKFYDYDKVFGRSPNGGEK